MPYVQRKFYLPEETYTQLSIIAKTNNKTITQLLRELLNEGLANFQSKTKPNVAKALLAIVQKAEQKNWHGHKDLAQNHDKYFIKASSGKQG